MLQRSFRGRTRPLPRPGSTGCVTAPHPLPPPQAVVTQARTAKCDRKTQLGKTVMGTYGKSRPRVQASTRLATWSDVKPKKRVSPQRPQRHSRALSASRPCRMGCPRPSAVVGRRRRQCGLWRYPGRGRALADEQVWGAAGVVSRSLNQPLHYLLAADALLGTASRHQLRARAAGGGEDGVGMWRGRRGRHATRTLAAGPT